MSKTKFEMCMEAAQALDAAYVACTMAGLVDQAEKTYKLRQEVALAIGELKTDEAGQSA